MVKSIARISNGLHAINKPIDGQTFGNGFLATCEHNRNNVQHIQINQINLTDQIETMSTLPEYTIDEMGNPSHFSCTQFCCLQVTQRVIVCINYKFASY
jgi:hypothetical protein